jgi:hypothetical protein
VQLATVTAEQTDQEPDAEQHETEWEHEWPHERLLRRELVAVGPDDEQPEDRLAHRAACAGQLHGDVQVRPERVGEGDLPAAVGHVQLSVHHDLDRPGNQGGADPEQDADQELVDDERKEA